MRAVSAGSDAPPEEMLWKFNLESHQNLPRILPSTTHLTDVAIGVCFAHTVIKSDLARVEEGGCKIEDLMVLSRNLPQAPKSATSLNKLAQVVPPEVFVHHLYPYLLRRVLKVTTLLGRTIHF